MGAAATGGAHFLGGHSMRKLMLFSVGFALACALGAYVFPQQYLFYGIIALAAGIALLVAMRWFRLLRYPAVLLIAFAIGVGWFVAYNTAILTNARHVDSSYV